MDEILASIRRIIADDQEASVSQKKPPPPDASEDEVLDLAELEPAAAQEEGEMAADTSELAFQEDERTGPRESVEASGEAAAVPIKDDRPQQGAEGASPISASAAEPGDPSLPDGAGYLERRDGAARQLISEGATASVNRSFGLLSHTILTQNARTLEDLVGDMLKPMLREWLDDHLPPLVERLVRMEIERVARGSR